MKQIFMQLCAYFMQLNHRLCIFMNIMHVFCGYLCKIGMLLELHKKIRASIVSDVGPYL